MTDLRHSLARVSEHMAQGKAGCVVGRLNPLLDLQTNA
jgi:hypothetical protein